VHSVGYFYYTSYIWELERNTLYKHSLWSRNTKFNLSELKNSLSTKRLLGLINVGNVHRTTGWSNSLCVPDDYSTINMQKYFKDFQSLTWRWLSQNTLGVWTVLYWTWSLRTQFGVSIVSGDWWGTLWTLLVTFCIVIIRCTETFF
jgi:hypothetical protein